MFSRTKHKNICTDGFCKNQKANLMATALEQRQLLSEFEFDQKPTISNYIAIQNFVVKSVTGDKTVCLAMGHCASAYWNDSVSSYLGNHNKIFKLRLNYIQIEQNDYVSPLQLYIYRSMVVNDDIDIMRMLKSKDRNIFRFLEIFLGSKIHVNTDCNFVTEHTTSQIQAKQV